MSADTLLAMMVAVSFAAGLNLYATVATLGLLARTNLLTLPPSIAMLSNDWVIGASLVLFLVEFFADKIPAFDLVWNVLHTFVRVPAAALLAWSTTSSLPPEGQVLAAGAGGAIAFVAHSGKLAMRGAATTSPEPFSNVILSLVEDAVAIGLTWFAAAYPFVAAAIVVVLLVMTIFVIRWTWRLMKIGGRRLRDWLTPPPAAGTLTTPELTSRQKPEGFRGFPQPSLQIFNLALTVYNIAAQMRLKVLGWVGIVWGGFVLLNGGYRALTAGPAEGAFAAGQLVAIGLGAFMLLAGIHTLRSRTSTPVAKGGSLHDFATRYTAAWCSQNAASVAAFFARHGSLTINGGKPAVGRAAITAAAQSFMSAFPDMVVTMDRLEEGEGTGTYHWTLTGTNTGPDGTGKSVRISGCEEWVIGSDGLIVDSVGRFDEAEYQRQLK